MALFTRLALSSTLCPGLDAPGPPLDALIVNLTGRGVLDPVPVVADDVVELAPLSTLKNVERFRAANKSALTSDL